MSLYLLGHFTGLAGSGFLTNGPLQTLFSIAFAQVKDRGQTDTQRLADLLGVLALMRELQGSSPCQLTGRVFAFMNELVKRCEIGFREHKRFSVLAHAGKITIFI